MSCRKKYIRDGTHQFERVFDALLPQNILIEDRNNAQLLQMIRNIAADINFFTLENKPVGTWEAYFPENVLTPAQLEDLHNAEPSFALLLTFLELYKHLKTDINSLTGKHLYHYYQEHLNFLLRPPKGEKIHLIFEPGKNVISHLIKEGTLVTAGKDENNIGRLYSVDKEMLIHPAQVAALKSIYIDQHEKVLASSDASYVPEEILKTGTEPAWSAFGSDQTGLPLEEQTMSNAEIGFALASPQLLLEDGTREVRLILTCTKQDPLINIDINLIQDISIVLSTEKEWFAPVKNSILVEAISATQVNFSIHFTLKVTDPPVIGLSGTKMAGELNTSQPVAKIILAHTANKYKYTQLRTLQLDSAEVSVRVTGKKLLAAQNDNGNIDPAKPFFPYGVKPDRGSSLYIGSAEVFSKSLCHLQVNYKWENLPANDFDSHYSGYNLSGTFDNQIFKANLALLYGNEWQTISSQDLDLFNSSNGDPNVELELNSINNPDTGLPFERIPTLEKQNTVAPNTSYGFIRLQFLGAKNSSGGFFTNFRAFGHQEYSNLYTDVAISKALENGGTFPNQPYTPVMSELSLDYESVHTITLSSENSIEQLFHIEPFGTAELSLNNTFSLLPQYYDEGNFFLALNGITAPTNISLLFQVAEGTAQANPENPPEDIRWSFLTSDGWQEFNSLEILTDTTQGLQKSGILEFEIGSKAIDTSNRFPEMAYWFKASIPQFSEGVSKLIQILPNAVEASYVFPENEDEDLPEAVRYLPAESVKKLLVQDGKVKKVLQPFPSFDGKSSETENNFLARVSERLRHKNRAANVWDYERIVLEQFPEIYKVKCLEHASVLDDFTPGSVTLLVISNLRNKNIGNPLEPKTGFDKLTEIKEFIKKYTSPFVEINVENPLYEQLLVDFKVSFNQGYDSGFYLNQLNEDIKQFLSPWAYEEGVDIVFGGKIYRSDILQFVENQFYVDYVTDFKLYHIYEGPNTSGIGCMEIEDDFIVFDFQGLGLGEMTIEKDFVVGYESEVAIGNTPRSIMVSAPNHRIELIEDMVCHGGVFGGIGFMSIEIDFITS